MNGSEHSPTSSSVTSNGAGTGARVAVRKAPITLALLHMNPRPGEIARNKRSIERAVFQASTAGAKFIVGPELAISGYGFRDVIGTDWIAREQAKLFHWAGELARRASACLVLGSPEAARPNNVLFNSMILSRRTDPDWGTIARSTCLK